MSETVADCPYLPPELIDLIISSVPRGISSQAIYYACTLVSRSWYHAAIAYLYRYPRFSGKQYRAFVSTICPSVNPHVRQSALAGYVRKLDMSALVHDGSKSLTARVLGRLKGNLEEYIAPQTSFGISSFAALSKCSHLTHLDLTLLSESVTLTQLFHTLKSLSSLLCLRFPRSSVHELTFTSSHATWPPRLQSLYLGDGISASLYRELGKPPTSLVELHLATQWDEALTYRRPIIFAIGAQLTRIILSPRYEYLDRGVEILDQCRNLVFLRASHLLIAQELNVAQLPGRCPPEGYKLEMMTVDWCPIEGRNNRSATEGTSLTPANLSLAFKLGHLARLRRVRITEKLGWSTNEGLLNEMRELVDLMEDAEASDNGAATDDSDESENENEEELEDEGSKNVEARKEETKLRAGIWIFPDVQP